MKKYIIWFQNVKFDFYINVSRIWYKFNNLLWKLLAKISFIIKYSNIYNTLYILFAMLT